MNPLLDNVFLTKLNNDRNRTIYARIISLNQQEYPIEQLEGIVTAGSISIDGNSAVRRSCSLTLSAKNLEINDVYWGISTKIKIEIGLQNNLLDYQHYGEIIWFKQGVFILTDFKTSQSINNYTINLTGKDKMCLLNGDVSGNIPAPTVFDSYSDQSGQQTIIDSSGNYNSFQDEIVDNIILDGFQHRYGSDYKYIRGVKKIISLQYKPYDTTLDIKELKGTIRFYSGDKKKNLKELLTSPNSKGYYDINLDEYTLQGFIIEDCCEGDIFKWEIEQKIPIPIIIQELLHQYGQETYSNIIIKNIDPYALEMLDNDTGKTLYLLNDGQSSSLITQNDLLENYGIYSIKNKKKLNDIIVNANGEIENIVFESYIGEDSDSLIDINSESTLASGISPPTVIAKKTDLTKFYTIRAILDQDVIGYGMTLLVYPDELRGNVGDSITSILDKIVNMLGNYEYFYNLDGQFIFQMKPAYFKTAWNGTIYLNDEDTCVDPKELINSVAYIFDDATLTTQYANSPNLNNIKNDYIIWGERKTTDQTVKFHGRYAIENPPIEYTDFNGYTWTTSRSQVIQVSPEELQENPNKLINKNGRQRKYAFNDEDFDWRHLISIMADDWYQHHTEDDYEINLRQNNCWPGLDIDLFPLGKTGYEQFYLDLSTTGGFWGDLYNTKYIKYLYIKKYPELFEKVYKNGQYLFDSEYLSLFSLYDEKVCQLNKYKEINKQTSITVIENNTKQENNIYTLTVIVKDKDSQINLQEELFVIYQYIEKKQWQQILSQSNTKDDKSNQYQYQLTCSIKTSILTENIIQQEQSFIVQLLNNVFNEETTLTNNISLLYAKIIIAENQIPFFQNGAYKYWNKNVIDNPEQLTFWFDFFKADEMGIGKFATSVIGDRPKTINDTSIKTIIYRDTPDVIYCSWSEYFAYKESMGLKDGYPYIIIDQDGIGYPAKEIDKLFSYLNFIKQAEKNNNISQINSYLKQIKKLGFSSKQELETYLEKFLNSQKQENFIRSIRGKNVHEEAESMLYNYSYYNDSVNITSVPIYYLQPNTLISVKDNLSKIAGYYIINKINISLAYNGTMQLTTIKFPERIY